MRSALSRVALVGLALALVSSCQSPKPPSDASRAPRVELQPVRLDYVDADGFDLLFETTLRNGTPVIVVQTEHAKPEWGARLNAWIAAWNAGRRPDPLRARGQIPGAPTVVVDGDSIREFRLLIDGLVGRSEESARTGARWWAEQRVRDQRVALLRPYSLRFHLGRDGRIQLIFFHGDYAAHHEAVVRALADPAEDEPMAWAPGYHCSRSKELVRKAPTLD